MNKAAQHNDRFSKRALILASFTLVVFLIVIIGGCATTGPQKESYSGFLHDYSQLEPDPDYRGQLTWILSNEDLKKYTKFIIDPISFHLSPELQDQPGLDPRFVSDITGYMESALMNALEPEYQIVDFPDHDTARLRVAITGVTVSRQHLKAYQFIPVALVITGASEAAGVRDKMAAVLMEAEALDSMTGKRLAAVVQRSGDKVRTEGVTELKAEQIYPILDFYARKMRARLDKIHGGH